MAQFRPSSLFQLAYNIVLLYTIFSTLALLHEPAGRISLILCLLGHFRSILFARDSSSPERAMCTYMAPFVGCAMWERVSMLLLPHYVLKNAIKGLHYCMEFCWEGYKDRGHLQNSGPGLASGFKPVLSPKLFGAKIFALLSHCSLPLSLHVCVYEYTRRSIRCGVCVCLFVPHPRLSPSVCM